MHQLPLLAAGFVRTAFQFHFFNVSSDVCVGKPYSFAIFGVVVALRELQMCMALSVGVVQTNLSAIASIISADVRNVNADASRVKADVRNFNAEAKI